MIFKFNTMIINNSKGVINAFLAAMMAKSKVKQSTVANEPSLLIFSPGMLIVVNVAQVQNSKCH